MFSRLATLLPIAALVAVATAAPNAVEARGTCMSSGNYCCNQTFNTPTVVSGLLGGILAQVGVAAGLTCDPITVIGVSGTSCTTQTACCENNNVNGVVNVMCTPINVNA